jgi:cytochrome P450
VLILLAFFQPPGNQIGSPKMNPLFSDEARRNPYPLYEQMRRTAPVFRDPESKLWFLFDYDSVKRALTDQVTFSSRLGPAEWMIFLDPPRHSKLRALVAQAFTPRSVVSLEPRIKALSAQLLDTAMKNGRMDMADDFAVPLPMMVIGEMLGIPHSDLPMFKRWNDILLNMSYTVPGGANAAGATDAFNSATAEMHTYLSALLAQRLTEPRDDLLTRLQNAEIEGERLNIQEILGFFQLLLLAGSETTTNLVNNAILCFIEHPDELARLRSNPELLPSAIEEVLRYRSPLHWMFRVIKSPITLHDQTIPAGNVALAMLGAANRDPKHFPRADQFEITRDPNPHVAFGHGMHFCLGAPLARLEAKIALTDFLSRTRNFRLASNEPWKPRQGLHVHGPTNLPITYEPVNA